MLGAAINIEGIEVAESRHFNLYAVGGIVARHNELCGSGDVQDLLIIYHMSS